MSEHTFAIVRLVDANQGELFPISRRVHGRGEYRGLTFHEIEAKTIISKAPPSTPWFTHSINAYRGCSHACSYCLAGETPILMADGTTRPLASLRRGDKVYGTARIGTYRRLVESEVLDCWSTFKPAYRITAGNDTVLIASGDHRFLTDRGWKHVTESEQGIQRSHLTTSSSLIGIDSPSPSPGGVSTLTDQIRVRSIESLDETPMYDITTTTGDFIANGVISHNCFARPTHEYLDFNQGTDFDTQIVVKVNAVERLGAETEPAVWGGHSIAMGTNTDPYQAAEGKYKLTRGIIEVLLERSNPFSLLTKSTLVLRDLSLLREAAAQGLTRVDFSIATIDEDVWHRTEPGTTHPRRRLEAVAKLREAGVPSGVMMMPLLPGISDQPEKVAELRRAAEDAGAEWVHQGLLHLRGVRGHFLDWLAEDSPELVAKYEALYPERKPSTKRTAKRSSQVSLF